MSRNRVPDVLLNDVLMMFLDDECLKFGHRSEVEDDDYDSTDSSDMSDSEKVTRVRFIRNSLKLSFHGKPWSSMRRSKSGDFKNATGENDVGRLAVDRRRAISASPSTYHHNPAVFEPVPAPLLVEDPPSSDNVSDLEDLRHHPDPALLNGSSGNFGSAGARSAPSTPQGLLASTPGGFSEPLSQPCSPGYITPSIQRSPSHNLFSKYDKGTLKQLSCSTPAMTAQAQSPEPPSPKAASKDDKPTTSKARQKKFRRHFPAAIEDDVLNYYSCALIGDILLQGHLYITTNYFAFYSNVFGYVTKLLIPLLSVEKITKEKTARIIPNAIGISTFEDKHVFGSLMSRDSTYRFMHEVWDRARNLHAAAEPTILPIVNQSDLSDSSETREESGRESAPEVNTRFRKCTVKPEIRKNMPDRVDGSVEINLDNPRSSCVSKQRLLLFASTLLLVLLFLSAAVLLYRIGKIQHKYSLALQDNFAVSESEDVYNELFQWQSHLHSKSAGAVHNFLDTNLDQIAKVRQSLEALSTLLMPNESSNAARKSPDIPNDS